MIFFISAKTFVIIKILAKNSSAQGQQANHQEAKEKKAAQHSPSGFDLFQLAIISINAFRKFHRSLLYFLRLIKIILFFAFVGFKQNSRSVGRRPVCQYMMSNHLKSELAIAPRKKAAQHVKSEKKVGLGRRKRVEGGGGDT